jgi:hypothetical protein
MNYIQYDDTVRYVAKFTAVRDEFHLLDLNKMHYGRLGVGVKKTQHFTEKVKLLCESKTVSQ